MLNTDARDKLKHGLWKDYFPHWDLPDRIAAPLADVLTLGPRDPEELAFAKTIEALAKIELHVHLEAAVPADFYATQNRRLRLFDDTWMPIRRAPFESLADFIRAWLDHTRLIDHESLLSEMGRDFVDLRAKSNIRYTEAHISPFDFVFGRRRLNMIEPPLDFTKVLASYLHGIKAGMAKHPGTEVRLIMDTLWVSTPQECDVMLSCLKEILASSESRSDKTGDPLIVAIGLGGPERIESMPAKLAFIDRCRELGLRLDIHSGEITTASEHRRSLDLLCPDRVSHGIAPAVAHQVNSPIDFFTGGLAVCPTSNLLTRAFAGRLHQHPIRAMLDQRIPVCVNTDDPLLFGTNLTLEFVALRRAINLDLSTVTRLNRHAGEMAFDPVAKQAFMS